MDDVIGGRIACTAGLSNMLALAVSQLAALSGPPCTRPALRAPVVSRAARHVVCAEAEAESTTNADDEGRDRGVRGARILGFAGGAVAGRCAKLKFLPKLSLLSCTHCCTQRRVGGRPREQRRPVGAYLSGAPARSPHATAPAGDAALPPQVAGPALSDLSKAVESGGASIKVSDATL